MLEVWVLWIFMSAPWHFGPVPVSPGWWGAAVTTSEEECTDLKSALLNGGEDPATLPVVCLPADAVPPSHALVKES